MPIGVGADMTEGVAMEESYSLDVEENMGAVA